jgi:hypothetical protein
MNFKRILAYIGGLAFIGVGGYIASDFSWPMSIIPAVMIIVGMVVIGRERSKGEKVRLAIGGALLVLAAVTMVIIGMPLLIAAVVYLFILAGETIIVLAVG